MKTLIVYASKHGTTETCAKMLAESLADGAELRDLAKGGMIDLTPYDAVVVGGSIYAGVLRKDAKHFCNLHKAELLERRFGCFLCQASPASSSKDYFENNFDADLLAHAAAKASFGGQLNVEKLGFWERKIMGAVAWRTKMVPPKIDEERIRSFALAMEVPVPGISLDD